MKGSREMPQFKLRIPDDLLKELRQAAKDERVLCYPRDAWLEVHNVDIAELF